MIQYMCILYFWEDELFAACDSGIHSSDKKLITSDASLHYKWAHGRIEIESKRDCINVWNLQIMNCKCYGFGVTIGVSVKIRKIWRKYVYYVNSGWLKKAQGDMWSLDKAGTNDIISVNLDTKRRMFWICINNTAQRVGLRDIPIGDDIKYRLAVALSDQASVKLLNFIQQ